MEQYQSMAKSIQGLKKPLILIALISMIAHLFILGAGTMIHLEESSPKYTTLEACHYGMKSIFENSPDESLLSEKIIKDIKDKNFEVEELSLIKVIDGYNCDVVIRDTKGYRSYLVSLEKNSKFDHFYKVLSIEEQKLVSTYQWRKKL